MWPARWCGTCWPSRVGPRQPAGQTSPGYFDFMQLAELAKSYAQTRELSERLCEPLATEDYVVQSMPDASPTRWHLAHTTWFFETFVLAQWNDDYRPFHPHYQVLFNSYYNRIGEQFPRPRRGLLTRPTVREVFEYRHAVDEQIARLLNRLTGG